jgi:hypothetical protein
MGRLLIPIHSLPPTKSRQLSYGGNKDAGESMGKGSLGRKGQLVIKCLLQISKPLLRESE